MELERYRRQLNIPEIGTEGQNRLAASSVLVVWAGGLGGPVLYALAGAGVGRLVVMDGDTVSLSNLNRQFLYTQADLGWLSHSSSSPCLEGGSFHSPHSQRDSAVPGSLKNALIIAVIHMARREDRTLKR